MAMQVCCRTLLGSRREYGDLGSGSGVGLGRGLARVAPGNGILSAAMGRGATHPDGPSGVPTLGARGPQTPATKVDSAVRSCRRSGCFCLSVFDFTDCLAAAIAVRSRGRRLGGPSTRAEDHRRAFMPCSMQATEMEPARTNSRCSIAIDRTARCSGCDRDKRGARRVLPSVSAISQLKQTKGGRKAASGLWEIHVPPVA